MLGFLVKLGLSGKRHFPAETFYVKAKREIGYGLK
jgi:hypothetical protein